MDEQAYSSDLTASSHNRKDEMVVDMTAHRVRRRRSMSVHSTFHLIF
jgi:hypothetical protein